MIGKGRLLGPMKSSALKDSTYHPRSAITCHRYAQSEHAGVWTLLIKLVVRRRNGTAFISLSSWYAVGMSMFVTDGFVWVPRVIFKAISDRFSCGVSRPV